jgi:hypothetical protein
VYRIHKVCNTVTVPALRPVHFEAGTPPERGYRLLGATTIAKEASPPSPATPSIAGEAGPR